MCHLNVYTSQLSNVVDFLWKVCKENIAAENCVNYTNLVIKEEKFCVMDHILDNKIEHFIINDSRYEM